MKEEEIGTILQNIRKEQGLTQDEVAKHLNIGRQAVLAIEKGDGKISLWEYIQLVELFNRNPLLSDTNIAGKTDKQYKRNLRTIAKAVVKEILEAL